MSRRDRRKALMARGTQAVDHDAPGLLRMQQSWSGYLRAPTQTERPAGTAARRIDVYAELLRNNIRGFIDQCFPLCRASVSAACWEDLIEGFFSQGTWHHSPFFHEIPRAFVDFLQSHPGAQSQPQSQEQEQGQGQEQMPSQERVSSQAQEARGHSQMQASEMQASEPGHEWVVATTRGSAPERTPACEEASRPPWFADLAHYEWLELAVETAPDVPAQVGPQGLALAAGLQLAGYEWPVHTIGPGAAEVQPATTFVAVYRNRQHVVRFSVLTPAAAQLLATLQGNMCDWQAACAQLATQWGMPVQDMVSSVQPLQQQWLGEELLVKKSGQEKVNEQT
jgi:Uncharacterized protein conserved in bacteria